MLNDVNKDDSDLQGNTSFNTVESYLDDFYACQKKFFRFPLENLKSESYFTDHLDWPGFSNM